MDRLKIKYVIDVILGVSFLSVFVTGIIKFPGLVQALGYSRADLPFAAISRLHDISGVIMGMMVFAHLAMNWQWIVCMTRQYMGIGKKSKK